MNLFFFLFASITVLSAIAVISSRNPVHSVLFLILAFVNSAGLFVLAGAEFLAMVLLIVYVGAVAVLFLFVVMMLNVNYSDLKSGFLNYLPFGGLIGLVLIIEIGLMIGTWKYRDAFIKTSEIKINSDISNTEAIGNVLYTKYFIDFQLSGVVLLLAMIGAIVLTHVYRPSIKRQSIDKQNTTFSKDRVKLINTKAGEGIQSHD